MTWIQHLQGRYGVWVYPPIEYGMPDAGLQEMGTYVSRCLNMVAQFLSTSPILNLCMVEERIKGSMMSKRWWEQDRVDVEGMRTAAWGA